MYICICNAVTEREIRGAVSLGCDSVAALRAELGVASCCGKCEPDARRIIEGCAGGCTGPCHGEPSRAGFGPVAAFAAGD